MIIVVGSNGKVFDVEFSSFSRFGNGITIEGVILGNTEEVIDILESIAERGSGVVQVGDNVFPVKLSSYWIERGKSGEGMYITMELEVI